MRTAALLVFWGFTNHVSILSFPVSHSILTIISCALQILFRFFLLAVRLGVGFRGTLALDVVRASLSQATTVGALGNRSSFSIYMAQFAICPAEALSARFISWDSKSFVFSPHAHNWWPCKKGNQAHTAVLAAANTMASNTGIASPFLSVDQHFC